MQQVYLFTGQADFLLEKERKRWKNEFTARHGEDSLMELDGSSLKLFDLLNAVRTAPFFAERRLVIIRTVPRYSKEEIEELLRGMHPHTFLVFFDAALDKRTSSAKLLLASATVKEYAPLPPAMLLQWLKTEANDVQCTFADNDALQVLIDRTEGDMFVLAASVRMLALLPQPIEKSNILKVILPSGRREVWELSNLLTRRDSAGMLTFLGQLRLQGEDVFSLWNILLWLLRSCTAVALAQQSGVSQPAAIASSAGLPPFTVRTLLSFTQTISRKNLQLLHCWICDRERDIKTGALKATVDAPQELMAVITVAALRMCSL